MANCTKFFRNGKTFSAFCRMRYGQSKLVWDDTSLWAKSGRFAIGLDLAAADAKFGGSDATMNSHLKPAHREASFDRENYEERRREDMMDYMAANGNLDAYYEDVAAGYAY